MFEGKLWNSLGNSELRVDDDCVKLVNRNQEVEIGTIAIYRPSKKHVYELRFNALEFMGWHKTLTIPKVITRKRELEKHKDGSTFKVHIQGEKAVLFIPWGYFAFEESIEVRKEGYATLSTPVYTSLKFPNIKIKDYKAVTAKEDEAGRAQALTLFADSLKLSKIIEQLQVEKDDKEQELWTLLELLQDKLREKFLRRVDNSNKKFNKEIDKLFAKMGSVEEAYHKIDPQHLIKKTHESMNNEMMQKKNGREEDDGEPF